MAEDPRLMELAERLLRGEPVPSDLTDGADSEVRRGLEKLRLILGGTGEGTGPPVPEARPDRGGEKDRGLRPASPLDRFVGDYRLVRTLGEGGMGIVYEAEQQNPRRPVALKVIRGGAHVGAETLKLFQREAQTLARLRHPGIAQLYATGATEDGLHYFAMELVRGSTLTAWLGNRPAGPVGTDELKLRLSVFRRICDAVAYAHQKGVIHRDLKPANVLVPAAPLGSSMPDPVPDVKVLDFGLARITDSDIQATHVTEMGQVRGTLPYMSPEQVRGNPDEIDQRTDVYSLGVILYEMVAGQLPYDLGKAQLPEAVRVICQQPPRSLSTVSGRRLPDDVVTIVGKCLEKEPARRYPSAAALAEDVQRFLADQPIQARPPSAIYQFRKMVARHRGPFAFAATVFVLVAGLAVASTVQAVRLARERDRAGEEAATAREVSEFLEGIFKVADPSESRGQEITAIALLDRGSEQIERELGDEPSIQARLMLVMGQSYQGLGLHARSEPLLQRALEIRQRVFGADSLQAAEAMSELAWARSVRGGRGDVLDLHRKAVAVGQEKLGPGDARSGWWRYRLGVALYQEGKLEEARGALVAAQEILRSAEGEDSKGVVWCHNDLATVSLNEGDLERALEHQEAALAIRRRMLTPQDPDLAIGLNNVAELLARLGRLERARRLAEEAVACSAVSMGARHGLHGYFLHTLADIQRRSGDLPAADRTLEAALPVCREYYDPTSTPWSEILLTRAIVSRDLGRTEEAERTFRELLPLVEDTRREGGQARLKLALEEYAALLRRMGKVGGAAEAEARARELG